MVSLAKAQSVSLKKVAKSGLNRVSFGLGWDPAKKPAGFLGRMFGSGEAGSIDLDASVILLDQSGNRLDVVWFRQMASMCGSVTHSGDNRTGEGDGDDETIRVDLEKLPTNVEYLCFTVNSFTGQTFNDVGGASCRVLDQNGQEMASFRLDEKGKHTGVLIASLKRNQGEWSFTAEGIVMAGRTIDDMTPQIVRAIVQ